MLAEWMSDCFQWFWGLYPVGHKTNLMRLSPYPPFFFSPCEVNFYLKKLQQDLVHFSSLDNSEETVAIFLINFFIYTFSGAYSRCGISHCKTHTKPLRLHCKNFQTILHLLNLRSAISCLPVGDFLCRIFIASIVHGFLLISIGVKCSRLWFWTSFSCGIQTFLILNLCDILQFRNVSLGNSCSFL